MRFDLLDHIGIAGVNIGTRTTILLPALGFSYMSMAWGLIAGHVTRITLTLAARGDHLRLLPGFKHWRDVLQFGGWLTAAGPFGTIAAEGRKLVLGGLINPGAVALLERAQQIPDMSRQMLGMLVGQVLLPSFSKDIREGRLIGPGVEMYVAAMTAIVWPAFLTVGFLAVPITVLLFGKDWREAGEILPYILGGAAIVVALPQPEQVLTPHGAVRRLAGVRFVHVTVALSFATVGSMHSLELFAQLQIPPAVIFSLTTYFSIRNLMGTTLPRLLPLYGKAALLTVLSATPTFFVYLEFGTTPPPIAVLLAAGAVAVPIWLLGLFTLRHPLSREMSALLFSVWGRFAPQK